MTRLMMFASSHAHVAARLAPLAGRLDLLLMDRNGAITLNGAPVAPEDAQPEVIWATGEMYGGRAAAPFMDVALKSSSLKWAHSGAAGLDHPIFAPLGAKGVRISNSHIQAISIAEYVLAEVLAHLQRIGERRAEQAAHRWTRLPFRELMDSRWLVIGFGAIGQGVAERVRGFGARVTGVRRLQEPHPLAETIAPLSAARDLAAEADVVVLSTPMTPETARLADARFFAGMKPGSVFVNVGRGGLVDEAALLAALDRGAPEFAILDVFDTEPLPPDSPFWDHPRVALTPHSSAFGAGLTERGDALFVENLGRYLDGRPLLSEVDPRDVPAVAAG
jgi:phosphoglycerate dehydrogenase-like enzyme